MDAINEFIQNDQTRHYIVYIIGLLAFIGMMALMLWVRLEVLRKSILTIVICILVALVFGMSWIVLSDFLLDEIITVRSQEVIDWTHTPLDAQNIITTMYKIEKIDKSLGVISPLHSIVEWYQTPLGPSWVLVEEDSGNVLEFQTDPPTYCPKDIEPIVDGNNNQLWIVCTK